VQIVIVGAGTVGFELAVQLQKQGHDVSMIEKDAARATEIGDKLDILVVEGQGSSPRALEQAGIREARMLLAVTSMDEVNIMACGLAARYDVPQRLARVRSPELTAAKFRKELDRFGVTRTINPERVIVRAIDQIARLPEAIEVFGYHDGDVLISRHLMTEDMPVVGKNLVEILELAGGQDFLAVALRRGNKTWIPAGDDVIEVGDDVTTLFRREALPGYLRLLNLERKVIRKAIVAGSSLTAIQMAESLEKWVETVILLDWDYEHGLMAADMLDGVEVLHGDPSEQGFLHEVGTDRTDLFVGAGEGTSMNVMSALLARSEGAKKVLAISLEPQSNRLFREIGVDHVISPRRLIAQEIMDLIHRGRISMELQLRDIELESIEIKAEPDSAITRKPLLEVWAPFRRKAIVGAIIRGGEVLIPRGDTQIEAGDDVILVTEPKTARKIQKLFGSGRS